MRQLSAPGWAAWAKLLTYGNDVCTRVETCGALTGGLMVLGLRHGHEMQKGPQRGRDLLYARVQDLAARFEAAHGSTECGALIGCDLRTPEGHREFAERGLHQGLCTELVASVVKMLEEESTSR